MLVRIAGQLDEKVAESQFRLLQVLRGKLSLATWSIQMPESCLLRRLRYSIIKNRLYELVSALENWQARLDPTWYLIILVSSGDVDFQCCALSTRRKQNDIFAARVSGEPIDASAATCIILRRRMAIGKVVFFFALYTIDTWEKQIDGVNHVAALPLPLRLSA